MGEEEKCIPVLKVEEELLIETEIKDYKFFDCEKSETKPDQAPLLHIVKLKISDELKAKDDGKVKIKTLLTDEKKENGYILDNLQNNCKNEEKKSNTCTNSETKNNDIDNKLHLETYLNNEQSFVDTSFCPEIQSLYNPDDSTKNKQRKSSKRLKNDTFICAHCDFHTFKRAIFVNHVQAHNKKFKCAVCDYATSRKNTLSKHVSTHEEFISTHRKYKCTFCKKSYKYRYGLHNHLKKKHSSSVGVQRARPFKCSSCNFEFYSRYELNRHSLTHTRALPYKCTICHYAAARAFSVALHMFKHDRQSLLVCPGCGKKYSKSSNLENHLRTECSRNKEKNRDKVRPADPNKKYSKTELSKKENLPFNCGTCGYGTTHHSLLKYHVVLHHTKEPIFKCLSCNYSSFRKEDLRKHKLRVNHDVFCCHHCDYRGLRYLDIEKHMKTHIQK